MPTPLISIQIRVNQETYERLKANSRIENISIPELIKMAIESYIKKVPHD